MTDLGLTVGKQESSDFKKSKVTKGFFFFFSKLYRH